MSADLMGAIARRLRSESGFTLIEMLVAAMVAAVALIALAGTFDSSRDAISGAEQMETATHIGEQELERIEVMSYGSVGLTSAPSHSANTFDPAYYVTGSNYQWDANTPSRIEPLVTGSGALAPSSSWQDDPTDPRLHGEIRRFVTWIYDPYVVQTPDKPEAKRVTVAVTLTGGKTPRKPVVLSSIIFNRKTYS